MFCCNISPANFGIVVECTKIIVCTLMEKCAKFGLHRLPKKHILHPYVCPKSKDCETHGQTDCCHSVIEYLTACKCRKSRKVHTNLRATFRPLLTPFLFARRGESDCSMCRSLVRHCTGAPYDKRASSRVLLVFLLGRRGRVGRRVGQACGARCRGVAGGVVCLRPLPAHVRARPT